MGKLIYLVSLLDGIDTLSLVLCLMTIPVTIGVICAYIDINYMKDKDEKKNDIVKIISKGIFVLIISIVTNVFIPSKEEMYLIALTKDYGKEELYQMSKNEIKDSVDYIFEKIEDVKE